MKILKSLSEAIGVSGAETEVRRLIIQMIEPHVDEIRTDTIGNLIAIKKGTGRSKRLRVMVDAHMDEVGLMVVGYDNNGMLKITNVGGIDARILPGKRVMIGSQKIPGVIGAKPIHLLGLAERSKALLMDSLRVDIGVTSKDSAKGKAPLGTRIAFDSDFVDLGGMLRGKAFDDRVGCAMLVHLLQGDRFPFDLVGSFTVQEEVGVRGAQIASHAIQPDVAIVLETSISDDIPQTGREVRSVRVGKGPSISIMDARTIMDKQVNKHLIATAEELNIPFQYRTPIGGGTNAGVIQRAREAVPVASVAVPCRYIHTPSAMLSKRDYRNGIKLVRESLNRLNRGVLKR